MRPRLKLLEHRCGHTGYGLSYSEFDYTASPSSLGSHHPCQAVNVEVTLSLTGGPTAAEEVAQVYVQDRVRRVRADLDRHS